MNRSLLVLPVTVIFCACATNPARRISVTEEEVMIHEDAQPGPKAAYFTRGADRLDEQEFYQAIDDQQSLEAVKSYRSGGSALQSLGVGAAVVGFLAGLAGLGAYYFSDESVVGPALFQVNNDVRDVMLYGGIGAAVIGALGVTLAIAMGPRVRGESMLYDLVFANRRMEIGRYGEQGATPEVVKSVSFGEGDEGKQLCGAGTLTLAPLVAKDEKGRHIKVTDRADWFTWTTTPKPDLVTHAPDAPVLSSPVGLSFEHVDADVSLSVKLAAAASIGHEMTFEQTYACDAPFELSGEEGTPGSRGRSGASGQSGGSSRMASSGGDGADGSDASSGGAGPEVLVDVAWVSTPKHGKLALLVVNGQARLFDPSHATASVAANGGDGGAGGRGGSGGSGGGGGEKCRAGANGGSGGRGGRGGTGGAGGHVVVRASDRALLAAVHASAEGGAGGSGGAGGDYGSGGSGRACDKGWATDGAKGTSGTRGGSGAKGPSGSVEARVVSAGELKQLAEVLSSAPQLSLLDSPHETKVAATKKRRARR